MSHLDDTYAMAPSIRDSAHVAAIEEGFFELGLDTREIADEVRVSEAGVVRVLHALRNERRAAKMREIA